LAIAMVTADADIPLNNSQGPSSLRDIRPSVTLARDLRCDLLRVCLKRREDIPFARQAARIAGAEGVRLAHQCHTHSLFEQVDPMLQVLAEIGDPNFGLIYEPANLMLCGEPYGLETLQRLRPHVMNVYVQNHRLDPLGPVALDTYCLGTRRFHHLPLWSNDGVALAEVVEGLRAIDYPGYFTIHQAEGLRSVNAAHSFAARCAAFVREAERSAS
ncbi:MAG: sugar phosphate isomerase/epimerase family protein, partial [Pirellulaceae bacterium]